MNRGLESRIFYSADPGTGGTDPAADPKPADPKPVTFTPEQQEHINKLIGDTRTKASSKASKNATAEYLKSLGFEKGDDLTAALAELKKRKEDKLSDDEKRTLREKEAAAERDALKAERDALRAELKAAKDSKVLDRKLLNAGIQAKHLKFASISYKEQVDALAEGETPDAAKIIASIKATYPEFFATAKPGKTTGDGSDPKSKVGGGGGKKKYSEMTDAEKRAYKKSIGWR